jgi:hypothetical protein
MKLSLIGFVVLGSLTTTIEKPFIKQTSEEKDGVQVTIPARTKRDDELMFSPIFKPKEPSDEEKPKRELWPVDSSTATPTPAEEGTN